MPQEKPAFFVEFFRNPLTEAYPEVFQPLGDGIELTRWWLGHDDPRRCSLFSLFAFGTRTAGDLMPFATRFWTSILASISALSNGP